VDSHLRLVEINLPDPLPILASELALIEVHFAQLITAMIEAEIAETEQA
jgi:hypothetical protein